MNTRHAQILASRAFTASRAVAVYRRALVGMGCTWTTTRLQADIAAAESTIMACAAAITARVTIA